MKLNEIFQEIDSNDDWGNNYKHFVPKFIEYAKNKKPITDWEEEDREQFLSTYNCISSLRRGNFSHEQRKAIVSNWKEVFTAPLYEIVTNDSFQLQTNIDLFDKIINVTTKVGGRNERAAALRFLTAFQPKHLSSIVANSDLWGAYQKLRPFGLPDYINSCNYDLALSHHIQSFINNQYPYDNIYYRSTYAWRLYDYIIDEWKESKGMGQIEEVVKLLKEKKNLILQGAPGTGKTYSTASIVVEMKSEYMPDMTRQEVMEKYNHLVNDGYVKFTTFHQSLDYEDFVEGLKPSINNGHVTYNIEPGILKKICEKATNDADNPYFLIIDEINRGNISKIFGELITLLEPDKRCGNINAITSILSYSKKAFSIPDNLYIIGTMNTTDRSVGTIDYALRRRFAFFTVKSDKNIISSQPGEIGNKALEYYNKVYEHLKEYPSGDIDLDDLMIGHSYFIAESIASLDLKWKYEVLPLLDEYYKDGLISKPFKE